jgi:serpin B
MRFSSKKQRLTMTEISSRTEQPLAELGDVFRVVGISNRFAIRLYSQVGNESPGNLFFSPSSIMFALAMTYSGAAGSTAREMADTLGFNLPPDRLHRAFKKLRDETRTGGVEFRVASRLWGQIGYRFLEDFLQTINQCYGAGWSEVDFRTNAEDARNKINSWVKEQTNGKINDIIPAGVLTPLTRLVLANAIYFLGSWEKEFDETNTKDDAFTTLDGSQHTVRMMNEFDTFCFGDFADYQLLELPYRTARYELKPGVEDGIEGFVHVESGDGGSDFVMDVILPRQKDGLPKIEARITGDLLPDWNKLQSCRVNVQLPKFRIDWTASLNQALEGLEMRSAFIRDQADFSGISDDPDGLFIESVLHKAFVEVNEKGTEAAAATMMIAVAGCAREPEPPKTFRADHPFLFLIRDRKSGLIHFMGRMATPEYLASATSSFY